MVVYKRRKVKKKINPSEFFNRSNVVEFELPRSKEIENEIEQLKSKETVVTFEFPNKKKRKKIVVKSGLPGSKKSSEKNVENYNFPSNKKGNKQIILKSEMPNKQKIEEKGPVNFKRPDNKKVNTNTISKFFVLHNKTNAEEIAAEFILPNNRKDSKENSITIDLSNNRKKNKSGNSVIGLPSNGKKSAKDNVITGLPSNRKNKDVVGVKSTQDEQLLKRGKKEKTTSTFSFINNSIYAYIGLLFIIVSLFVQPFYFAMLGYLLGTISYAKGSYKIGITTIGFAIFSLLVKFFLGVGWF